MFASDVCVYVNVYCLSAFVCMQNCVGEFGILLWCLCQVFQLSVCVCVCKCELFKYWFGRHCDDGMQFVIMITRAYDYNCWDINMHVKSADCHALMNAVGVDGGGGKGERMSVTVRGCCVRVCGRVCARACVRVVVGGLVNVLGVLLCVVVCVCVCERERESERIKPCEFQTPK